MLELAIEHSSDTDGQLRWMQKRIGFRVAALVTVEDTDVDMVEEALSGWMGDTKCTCVSTVPCCGFEGPPTDQLE
jgi:hypothetical protein